MTVIIEPLQLTDAKRCAELESTLFAGDDPWPASAFTSALMSPHTHYVAAREGPLMVGYAGIARLGASPPFEYEVHTIGVDPAYMGRGIGWRMLTDLLDVAAGDTVYLEVRTDNHAAIAMYEKAGFVNVGLRKRYYRVSGADAYTMRREAVVEEVT